MPRSLGGEDPPPERLGPVIGLVFHYVGDQITEYRPEFKSVPTPARSYAQTFLLRVVVDPEVFIQRVIVQAASSIGYFGIQERRECVLQEDA